MITCPKRSLTLGRWKTSVSLEQPFWDCFGEIAQREGHSRAYLARELDLKRELNEKLSNAIRVYVLLDIRARALEAERRAQEGDQHAAELRDTIKALVGAGDQAADMNAGLAPMSAVIAGGRANV